LYAEANFNDSSGAVVDYGNDALGSIQAYQVALMTFSGTDENISRTNISKITCY